MHRLSFDNVLPSAMLEVVVAGSIKDLTDGENPVVRDDDYVIELPPRIGGLNDDEKKTYGGGKEFLIIHSHGLHTRA